jgi:hypothetical protein
MPLTTGARRRLKLSSIPLIAIALLGTLAVATASAAPGDGFTPSEMPFETFIVSTTASGEVAEGGVLGSVLSGDGRYVAFLSAGANLSPETPGTQQAYVKDLRTGDLTLASRADGATGAPADEPLASERLFLSADGRFLTFTAAATNLAAGVPAGGATHVYRRDLVTEKTEIVDRGDGAGGEVPGSAAKALAISGDGHLVAFSDPAEGLDGPSGPFPAGEETIYVRDLATGTTTVVAAEGAEEAAFSADGRFLLFTSAAPGLPGANGFYQVYRRDLESGDTYLVSRGNPTPAEPEGEAANGEAFRAVFVGKSDCQVAFLGFSTTNLNGGTAPEEAVYVRDFCGTLSTRLVSLDEGGEELALATRPSGADGGLVAFEGAAGGDRPRLYLWNPTTQATTILSRPSGADSEIPFAGIEHEPMISANGCRAAFVASTAQLLPGEPDIIGPQAYVRQLAPCVAPPAPPDQGGGEVAPDGGPAPGAERPSAPAPAAAGPAPARSVAIGALKGRTLALSFDGAGRVRVRIQKLAPNGRGNWKLVKSIYVTATAAGTLEARLPRLGDGRYRLKLRLQGDPDNPTLTRGLDD